MVDLFPKGEAIAIGRVRLSSLKRESLVQLTSWVASALAPEWGIEELEAAVTAGQGVLIGDAEGAAIGAAVVLPGKFTSQGWSSAHPFDELRAGSSRASGQAGAATDGLQGTVACVPFISIEPARRFRGLGGEAALALERHLRSRLGVERVFAPVPDGRGLAVYFWLRLGYRPLTMSEASWPLVGLSSEPRLGIWMVREET